VLPFDFGFSLHGRNFLVEYDGELHFKPAAWAGGKAGLRKTRRHDQIKNEFAQKHGYILIRIPYTIGLDNISAYLCKALATKQPWHLSGLFC
jgi:hypothetical protein